MGTADEILENWEEEQYADWYAVDSYLHGSITRLFVGKRDEAMAMAADRVTGAGLVDFAGEPTEPGWDGEENTPFYRCLLIHASEARQYFDGIMERLSTDWITQKVAAEMLGVTKGRVSQLAKSGRLETLGKLVSRADVEKRMEGVRCGRPSKA